jgi:hypothetical protein
LEFPFNYEDEMHLTIVLLVKLKKEQLGTEIIQHYKVEMKDVRAELIRACILKSDKISVAKMQ